MTKRQFIARARIMSGLFLLAALLLITRLYFVQIVHGATYARQAMGQYTADDPETPARGSIFFTTSDNALVTAATQQHGWRIAINPKLLKNPERIYNELNSITPINKTAFLMSASKTSDPYEEVAYRLSDDQAAKVRALQIPGVMTVADEWRFYPGKSLAANVLGFVGYRSDGTSKTGVYGLEKEYDDTLSEANSNSYVNPFAEIFSSLSTAISTDPASHEGSIVTTIDPAVQAQLEMVLDGVLKQYTPQVAGGIVMDPRTGAIIAMAQRPTFDPNNYGAVSDPSVYDNDLVSGRYELGSIMKPLTMAAAIDSGAVTTSTTYDDTGCVTRSNAQVCNYDFRARGVIPMQQILSQSLNVGATFLADTMGHATLAKYFQLYGLGSRTGIDLPNEVQGDLTPLGNGEKPDVNYATAAFGQGIAISPIEMTRALAILANNGALSQPHIVSAIKYDSGITRSVPFPVGMQVIKPSSAEAVTNMLINVFDQALAHGALKMQHYSIAAKTGTAQIAMPGGGYYPNGVFLHSFFGYFPAHQPRFIVFLFAKEPHGVEYASASLAQPFDDMAKFIINYYNVPPDR